MIDRQHPGSERWLRLGADKGYDTSDFVASPRQKCVTPHVAQKVRGSAIDGRTTRHPGYKGSQQKRKRGEEPFGWAKSIAGLAKVKVSGLARIRHTFAFAMATYNLIRMPRLLAATA
jgi:hypothetical protein